MINLKKKREERNNVILVGLHISDKTAKEFYSSFNELDHLARTDGLDVKKKFVQKLDTPVLATLIGKGKLRKIRNAAVKYAVKTIIFNNELSPAQSRNIANFTKCNVVDRTELILDIFAQNAKTRQAKYQVELAQLEYSYTKLKRKWTHLSRIQGGIGFRGPGEKQIEIDRREIRKKISALKKRLERIAQTTKTKRKKRQNRLSISFVGYTNAGKTTLFNKLTKSHKLIADKLFATLDSTARNFYLKNGRGLIVSDTIGFIKDIPHRLINSFHSTLLEVIEADLLFHVVDISQDKKDIKKSIDTVNSVLEEIEANNKEILIIFNKTDKLDELNLILKKKILSQKYPNSIFISARTGAGITKLKDKIEEFVKGLSKTTSIRIPTELYSLISYLYENGSVMKVDYDEIKKEMILKVNVLQRTYELIKKQIDNFRFKKYLNK